MRRFTTILLILAPVLPTMAGPNVEDLTLCKKGERVVLSCETGSKGKTLSLCASKDFGSDRGYLIYRFGTNPNPEFVFPKGQQEPWDLFRYAREASPEHIHAASATTLTFSNGGATYEVFINVFDATLEKAGVRVTFQGKTSDIECVAPMRGDVSILQQAFEARSSGTQTRCGWIDNPTPANWSLEDRDGTWTIGIQGGYQADGEMPDFGDAWGQTNGPYGFGCACMKALADRSTMRITRFSDVRILPLQKCRSDSRLGQEGRQ